MFDICPKLSEPERRLKTAVEKGEPCDFTGDPGGDNMDNWGAERSIRGDILRRLVLDTAGKQTRSALPTITLKGAVIVGYLGGFGGTNLPCFRAELCRFDASANFDRATFTNGAQFDRSRFKSQVSFAETVFEGDARFDSAVFGEIQPSTNVAFQPSKIEFKRTAFKGDAIFTHTRFEREVSFERAEFEGDARFGGSSEKRRSGTKEERTVFRSKATFNHARFGNLADFSEAVFAGKSEFSQTIFGGDANFCGAIFGRFFGTNFNGATFKGNAEFSAAKFDSRASFRNASFDGNANFCRTWIHKAASFSEDADFYEVNVRGHADFIEATFGKNFRFDWTKCAGITLRAAKFGPESFLKLNGIQTEIANLRFVEPPKSLWLKYAQIGTIKDNLKTWPEARCLTGCAYQRIQADRYISSAGVNNREPWPPARWLRIRYWHDQRSLKRSQDRMGVASRVEWLKGEPNGYDPFRYDQLITAYRKAGMETEARFVALAKQRERRGTLELPGRIWGVIQDWLVGYGYRLWLPLVWLVILISLGSIIFHIGADPEAKVGAPSFESVYYATDLLFPVVNFGYKSNFYFQDWRLWLGYALMLAGWILAASVLAGVQRLVRRDET